MSGSLLPYVALPQTELLTVNEKNIPLHYHTGIAEVFTLQGSWNYVEYPDQVQTAGSYLYEPAGSVHTLVVPDTNNEDGTFNSILDAVLLRHLTDTLAEAQGTGPINYIGGGAAAFTA